MIHLRYLYAHNFKQLQEIDLHFPARARVLVQGKNEAGKSTLFEAVFFALFGTALVTETGSRSLDDLIRYGIEKAEVELHATVGARLFKIKRKIVRGKSNTWELEIERDGIAQDDIRGNAAVNKRLIDELGFDGDALLNTCFVEQKKLEKLEGLSKARREESLAKLLNLDALLDLENEFKISADDKRELERLLQRAELAKVHEELPTREKELHTVEGRLALVELRGLLDSAIKETLEVQRLDADIRALAARREQAAARVARLEELREAMVNVRAALDAHGRANENSREADRLRAQVDEARRSIQQTPVLQARALDFGRLSRHLERLGQIRAAQNNYAEQAEKLAASEKRVLELRGTLEGEQASLVALDVQVHEYDIGEALSEWIAAQGAHGIAVSVEEAQAKRDKISRWLLVESSALLAVVLAFLALALFTQSYAVVFFALAGLTLIALAVRATMQWRALAHAAEELGQARAFVDAGQAQKERAQSSQARLTELGEAIPESIDAARTHREMIARAIDAAGKSGESLRSEQAATRERILQARSVLDELQKQAPLADSADLSKNRVAYERQVAKAAAILARWQGRVTTTAQALGVPADSAAAQRALYQTQAQIEQLGKRSNEIAKLEQEISRRNEQAKSFLERAGESLEKATAVGIHPDNVPQTADDFNAFGKSLRKEYDALGGEDAVKHAREIEGELGRRQGERATRARNAELQVDQAKDSITRVGGEISPEPTLSELQQVRARFDKLELDQVDVLRTQQRELVGRVRSLQDQQGDLESKLGLTGESLIRADCESELKLKQRTMQVRDRGGVMVSAARRRIVRKVLPATMDYMRQILPALTRDRYHDAQLDEESYKIQVWDERASSANGQGGAFKEKNIFSGGTKDQFSLALRLAFAMATLPQERGTAPSFIFLDEPLSSFDDERAQALVYLLTEGEIARAFDQVFLISHVRVDERLFTHRVMMEGGRIAFTDLPNAQGGERSEIMDEEEPTKKGRS